VCFTAETRIQTPTGDVVLTRTTSRKLWHGCGRKPTRLRPLRKTNACALIARHIKNSKALLSGYIGLQTAQCSCLDDNRLRLLGTDAKYPLIPCNLIRWAHCLVGVIAQLDRWPTIR
jgi:hypothetical protein